jgi:hypothetical protein
MPLVGWNWDGFAINQTTRHDSILLFPNYEKEVARFHG